MISPSAAALVLLVLMPPASHYIAVPAIHTLASTEIIGQCYYKTYAHQLKIQFHPLCGRKCTYVFDGQGSAQGHCDKKHIKFMVEADWVRCMHVHTPKARMRTVMHAAQSNKMQHNTTHHTDLLGHQTGRLACC